MLYQSQHLDDLKFSVSASQAVDCGFGPGLVIPKTVIDMVQTALASMY